MRRNSSNYILALGVLFASCGNPTSSSEGGTEFKDADRPPSRDQIIERNREMLRKERELMDNFNDTNKLDLERSGTGIYYRVHYRSGDTLRAREGDVVVFNYRSMLLSGEPLYNSPEGEPTQVRIGKEQIELGLHEALQLMNRGDSAVFILPSHLAFGVAGDQQKVPPNSPVLYEVFLIDVITNP
ncbi:MAG: FKBP-type peptidyl-prolyl cis-trans isomerase [Bacteroidota bacterium]|nr:FKBP-type peptidyl-prolyl cis-trans isomerase [Bacteroidota bacterium]MDX5449114.1 FKBP-type peptidyl-prolyl cis-trans isomerase [Bacteroidota bacterium]MDX5505592.1 FKBP-type peptidyl-prolyl cis-trans isomerase [Bacteroidota bacterium]